MTEKYAYTSVRSVESIKLMKIIEAEERQNAQLLFAFSGLRLDWIYLDCNRIKGSFD